MTGELRAASEENKLPDENNKTGQSVPLINISISHQNILALIDTGASISCMSEQLALKLNINFTHDETKYCIKSISGSCLKIVGSAMVNIILDSYLFKNELIIIKDISQDVILGQDFLYKNKALIDFSNERLVVMNRIYVPFHKVSRDIASESNTLVYCHHNAIMSSGSLKTLSKSDYIYFSEKIRDNDDYVLGSKYVSHSLRTQDDKSLIDTININPDLRVEEKTELKNLFLSYRKCFAFSTSELGNCDLVNIEIKTTDEIPVHRPPYRVSPKQLEIINTQVDEMLKNGVIRESKSAYASPVVLVQKPDHTWRFCIDYRKLNKKVITDSYPLPIIEDIVIYLSGAKFFADLDLNSGYWQQRLSEKDKHKTAFVTPSGLYEFNVLPFGLKTSQAIFQRTMDKVLAGIKYKNAICYVDNILIWGKNFVEFKTALTEVLERLKRANLTLKPNKCSFGYNVVSVLGHEISGVGIRPDKKKLQALMSVKPPVNTKQVKSILGLFSYYRKFINHFADIVLPLTKLLKKGVKFSWAQEQQEAFDTIIKYMSNPPILKF